MKIIRRMSVSVAVYFDPKDDRYIVIDDSNPMVNYNSLDRNAAIGVAEAVANHNNNLEPVSMFG